MSNDNGCEQCMFRGEGGECFSDKPGAASGAACPGFVPVMPDNVVELVRAAEEAAICLAIVAANRRTVFGGVLAGHEFVGGAGVN
jgi:hypothetical protein